MLGFLLVFGVPLPPSGLYLLLPPGFPLQSAPLGYCLQLNLPVPILMVLLGLLVPWGAAVLRAMVFPPLFMGGFHILMGRGRTPNTKALASRLWAQWLTIGVLSTFLGGILWLSHPSSTVRAGLTHLMGGQTFLLQDRWLTIGVVLIFLGGFLRMSHLSSTIWMCLTHLMGGLPLRLHLWHPRSLWRLLHCVL